MLLHPTQATREPVPGEEQGTHLEPCAFCATANGATALTCWRCGADLSHGRLDELAMKRLDAGLPAAEPPPRAMPPAGVPIPTLYPSFNAFDSSATVPMTVALGLLRQPAATTTEEPTLDMATLLGTAALGGRQLMDPQAAAPEPEPEPGTSLVPAAPMPLTRRQRAVLAAGILATSTLAVLGGSMLLDHYETARVGAGWSTSAPKNDAADAKLVEDPAETLRRQPSAAGRGPAEAVPATATGDSAALAPLATATSTATSTGTTDGSSVAPAATSVAGTAATTAPTAAMAAPTSLETAPANPPPIDNIAVTPPTGPRATGSTTTAAASLPASATTESSVRRRNPSRNSSRYAAARRDAAESRDPITDRAAPAAPRPCTPGVAALGLCTP